MVARVHTVAFEGVEARLVEVQCAVVEGMPGFAIVGLPAKAVTEAKERVRAALIALGLALPTKRITVNLSPADMPKDGSHFDLPIALGLLAAIGALPADAIAGTVALGELSLDGSLVAVAGALPAALAAAEADCALICPESCGPEAAWVGAAEVIAPDCLLSALNHLSGRSPLAPAAPGAPAEDLPAGDLRAVRGQAAAKRALEIAAAGRHHVLMVGPPGAGKSMLARTLPGLLPPLSPTEALETAVIHSVAGTGPPGGMLRARPFQDPHHTASPAAIIGGGRGAGPGQVSLAHNGVLFLDELPEFPRQVLDTLRQPVETGEITVARANKTVRYPCRFLLIAAANPCRCGFLADPARACSRAPVCGEDYLGRVSGPMLDRFDIRLDIAPVPVRDLAGPPEGPTSCDVRARIVAARALQTTRYGAGRTNADAEGDALAAAAAADAEGAALLARLAERFGLTARAFHRIQRVARTIADLAGAATVSRDHIAEAAGYRLTP